MEEQLAGGVANGGSVTRDGHHVLRPSGPHSPTVHRFLSALRDAGFDGVPRPVGFDEDGRERLEFVQGDVALPPYPEWAQADEALVSAAGLLRRFHDASRLVVLDGAEWNDEAAQDGGGPVICHNDPCLENIVFRNGEAVALLDFDFAAPGSPVSDVARLAGYCAPVDDEANAAAGGWLPANRPARLRLAADAYGLDAPEREDLLAWVDLRIAEGGQWALSKVEAGDANFARAWAEGGGMEHYDRRRRWWAATRADMAAALA